MGESYINIAAAIVKQAMADYKAALKANKKNLIHECEQFFLSAWGQTLSANHGEYIIERCRKEVEAESEEEEKE